MRLSKTDLALIASLAIAGPLPAATADTSPIPPGLSTDCQSAYRAMKACLRKTLDAGAPESVRLPWEKQIADSVRMWRAMRGNAGIEQSCREITAKSDCSE